MTINSQTEQDLNRFEYMKDCLSRFKEESGDRVLENKRLLNEDVWLVDPHTHSTFSDGRGSVTENYDVAMACGLDYVYITDHNTVEQAKYSTMIEGISWGQEPVIGREHIVLLNPTKKMLDDAHTAELVFDVKGTTYELKLDLRFRQAHASGGLFPDGGTAGNLPSGESYIVPYEGEKPGEASLSAGLLPVELDGEVVVYRIAANKAVEVTSDGPISERERALINNEPAYANLAELGLGVLSDFGIRPIGTVLLDEKLGLHIAFGRSDHFGGQVGPKDFSSPEAVVHIDRVLSRLPPAPSQARLTPPTQRSRESTPHAR